MLRCFILVVLLVGFAGCAKKVELPQTTVAAANASEFSQFRAELGTRFLAPQLKDFDTAVQELKLDAMNRDVATSEAREADALAVMNGKSVHAVTVLGWEARRARFLREIAGINAMLQSDLKFQENAGSKGISSVTLARIESAKNVISEIQRNATATEHRLDEMKAAEKK